MEIDNREAVMNAIDDGLVDARDIVLCLVKYMSQDDVKDCMKVNELMGAGNYTNKGGLIMKTFTLYAIREVGEVAVIQAKSKEDAIEKVTNEDWDLRSKFRLGDNFGKRGR